VAEMIQIITEAQSTYAQGWEDIAALNKKLSLLPKFLGKMDKDREMRGGGAGNYKYIGYEQVATAMRAACDKADLVFGMGVVNTDSESWETKSGGTMVLRKVLVEVTFSDPSTGAMRAIRWAGEGMDTQDKGTAKALTSALKYFILRNLLTSDQDDIDPDGEDHSGGEKRESPARPYGADTVKRGLVSKAAKGSAEDASADQRGFIAGTLEQLFPNIADKTMRSTARAAVTNYLFGKPSTSKLTKGECDALSAWMLTTGADGLKIVDDHAITEAGRILESVGNASGQKALFENKGE